MAITLLFNASLNKFSLSTPCSRVLLCERGYFLFWHYVWGIVQFFSVCYLETYIKLFHVVIKRIFKALYGNVWFLFYSTKLQIKSVNKTRQSQKQQYGYILRSLQFYMPNSYFLGSKTTLFEKKYVTSANFICIYRILYF